MGMTMSQKILAAHAGLDEVKAGQLIEANLDMVLGNDVTSPVAINVFEENGATAVFDNTKIAMINVYRRLKAENLNAELILQVHDELIIESDLSCAERCAELLKEEMLSLWNSDIIPVDLESRLQAADLSA